MALKGSIYKRCGCKDPDTGKPLNSRCPKLEKRRHGSYTLDVRIDTTDKTGRRLKRGGYATSTAAQNALEQVRDLVKLGADDTRMRRRIGDLIFTRSKRGGELPTVEEIRRRLGAGADINAPSATVAEWLEEWISGKRRLKESTRVSYRSHMDNYLIPMLGDIPRDKLRVEHIAGLFDTIEEWNEEVRAAKRERRRPVLPDDHRSRKLVVSNATQHRILATLRNAYNAAVKRPGMIDWNPCLAVELPPETRDPAAVWGPDEVREFLEKTAEDRLAALYRIILLRGPRRGEAIGIRWTDLDEDDAGATIAQTILEFSGKVVFDTPKTRAGERWVSLDARTAEMIGEMRQRQRRERFAAGDAYADHGLVFCQEDGMPLNPGWVSWYFRRLTEAAELPRIKLHEGRHTAATLALEAGIDIKVVSDQLGHSTVGITQDLYTHVRRAVHEGVAEKVVSLLERRAEKGSSEGSEVAGS